MLRAIIQVNLNVLISRVVNFFLFFVFLQFCRLTFEFLLLFGPLYALGCAGVVDNVTELCKLGAVFLLLYMGLSYGKNSNIAISFRKVSCPSRQVSVRYPGSCSHSERPL